VFVFMCVCVCVRVCVSVRRVVRVCVCDVGLYVSVFLSSGLPTASPIAAAVS